VHRNFSSKAVCQVEVADIYDHKHQPLSEEDASAGLSRMSTDIAKALYRKLAIDGVIFSGEFFRTLKATYLRLSLDMVETYYNDAMMNGLHTDRHVEERSCELFAANIVEAGAAYMDNPMEVPFIPNWSRVSAADYDLLLDFFNAVKQDNEDYGAV
jgi:glucosyl-3-phosphoglycerate synthase